MDGCGADGTRTRPVEASSTHDMEVVMSVGSVSGSQSQIADLTRLAMAVQLAKGAQQAASPAVQAIEQQSIKAVAAGKLDTYA
jgi:hypothetical protein